MLELRVFISSPGDVAIERQRTENVLSRLNGEAAGLARLTAVRWETEYYQAHETFQTQIPPSTECDVVIGILKWRLGTTLPPGFDLLPDGEPYPSGTAYEILTAIDKRRAGGELPDVFVFRYKGGEPSVRLNDPQRPVIERDWAVLCGFFERWFHDREGHFLAAFNSYGPQDQPHPLSAEDDFEAQLEALLRKWLAGKIAGGRLLTWPAVKGSPYRALEAFGAKHAAVFFGRGRDIRVAMDLLRDAAAKDQRFLLVVGASGAGKSSLARAGVIPRLVTPGVVAAVDLWRIAVTRPGDSPDGPFASLATALLLQETALPSEEEGRGAALPEIAHGDAETPAELAALLAHGDASAAKTVVKALARVGARAKELGHHARDQRCDLVLLVDQLDELFAPSVTAEVRERYAALLAALVASGRVWVVATLRDDFYPAMLKLPALKGLKDAGASHDLAPPGAAELAEIVREPARAAGLTFEADPATGERLDERLLREADRPDMLPLVQLVLSRLWDGRATRDAATVLTLAAYEAVGGVEGIVAQAGDAALAKLDAAEQARLAPLIRQLAERALDKGAAPGTLTIRSVPLAEAAADAQTRALVDALVDARLLTLSAHAGRRGTAYDAAETAVDMRLAHQRVLSDWPKAAAIVADSADFYRVRDEVEAQRRRWEGAKRRGDLLLARGLPLAEARAVADRYGSELMPDTRAYIAASRRRANRAQAFGYAAAVVFAILAISAGIAAKVASDQRREAEAQRREAETQKATAQKNFNAARTTVDDLIFDIAQGLKDVAGMRVETIRTILQTAQKAVDGLLATAPDDPQLLRSRAVMLFNFSTTYQTSGELKDARTAAQESLAVLRKLAAQNPGNAEAQREVSVSLDNIGDVELHGGDQAGALAAYTESLAIRRKLVAQDPGNAQAQRDVLVSLDRVGDVKLQGGDQAGVLKAYTESLAIARKLAAPNPGNAEAQRDVSLGLERIGDFELQGGDQAGALAAYTESLGIRRKLAAQDPGNAQAERDVSVSLERIGNIGLQGGDQAGALAAFTESLAIHRKMAAQDPGNARTQRDVSVSLNRIGIVKLQGGDPAGALAAYTECLAIARKLAAQDPGNAQAQRDVSSSFNGIGNVKLQGGDQPGALAAYTECLAILRKLAAQDPGNAEAQRDVSISLNGIGNVELQGEDHAGALAAYTESLAIRRKLAAQDPGNVQAQRDVSISLNRIGNVELQVGDRAGALATSIEVLAIARKLAAQDPNNAEAQRNVLVSLELIGNLKLQGGDQAGALAAYTESLAIRRKLAAQDPGNAETQNELDNALGSAAYIELLVKDYAAALKLADEAIALAPDRIWLKTNRAHALMLLGRTDAARMIYLKYRGEIAMGTTTWEETVTDDFSTLRKAGIANPLMDEIEADFAKPK